MTISCLTDDYCPRSELHGEHGLSLYIESEDFSLLFDTGQRDTYITNAALLGIPLREPGILDAVVLSHGHYDHGGGLEWLPQESKSIPLYCGRDYGIHRYSRRAGGTYSAGLSQTVLRAIEAQVHVVKEVTQIGPGFFLLPQAGEEGYCSPQLIRKGEAGDVQDTFEDELSLVYVPGETKESDSAKGKPSPDQGIILFTGCAHRGIAAIARSALEAFHGRPLKAIVGGFHLVDSPMDRTESVARDLAKLAPEALYCNHCTGLNGYAALTQLLPGRVTWLACGTRISL